MDCLTFDILLAIGFVCLFLIFVFAFAFAFAFKFDLLKLSKEARKIPVNNKSKESSLFLGKNVFKRSILDEWFDNILEYAKFEAKNRGDGANINRNYLLSLKKSNNNTQNNSPSNKTKTATTNTTNTTTTTPGNKLINKVPRLVAWYTREPNCNCIYKYGTIACKANPFEWWLEEITYWVFDALSRIFPKKYGYLKGRPPNSCNINLYRNGNDCAGWHCDDEALFETESGKITIISFSLGASRTFEIREIYEYDDYDDYSYDYQYDEGKYQAQGITLDNGDVCTMDGFFQHYYQHRVPSDLECDLPRINLTWRWIMQHSHPR